MKADEVQKGWLATDPALIRAVAAKKEADARLFAVAAGAKVMVCDTATGKEVASPSGHTTTVTSLNFSPVALELAGVFAEGSVKVWKARTGEVIRSSNIRKNNAGAFRPDGRRVAAALTEKDHEWERSNATVYDADTDGRRAVTGHEGTLRLWDLAEGKVVFRVKVGGTANCLCFSGSFDVAQPAVLLVGRQEARVRQALGCSDVALPLVPRQAGPNHSPESNVGPCSNWSSYSSRYQDQRGNTPRMSGTACSACWRPRQVARMSLFSDVNLFAGGSQRPGSALLSALCCLGGEGPLW
jgi:WD40 repeat protein